MDILQTMQDMECTRDEAIDILDTLTEMANAQGFAKQRFDDYCDSEGHYPE
jgi:hypothetical protein